MNERKLLNVVAAIIKDAQGRIFATQRGYGEFKDMWEFPGGKIEPDEDPENALVREIQEELATEITVDQYVTTVEWDYPTFHLSMRCYLCSIVTGNLELLEHEDAKWLAKDELISVDWLPADLDVVRQLADF